jgi:hypothetical protein
MKTCIFKVKELKKYWAQGEDKVDETISWKIKGIDEDGLSLGIHKKKTDKNIVPLQTTTRGLE